MENTNQTIRKIEDILNVQIFTIPKSDEKLLNINGDKSFKYISKNGILYEGKLYGDKSEDGKNIKIASYDFTIGLAK